MIEAAMRFALRYHAGQVDKSGIPYAVHLIRTAALIDPKETEMIVAALLHDVVEDTPVTLDIIEYHFGKTIAGIVDSLTRRTDEPYEVYLARLRLDVKARIVKIADLTDNMSFDRLSLLPENERRLLWEKYSNAMKVIVCP